MSVYTSYFVRFILKISFSRSRRDRSQNAQQIVYLLIHTDASTNKMSTSLTGGYRIKLFFQVTWIRRKDRQLLTVGRGTHSIDTRFVVVPNSPDWNLLIKNIKHEDAGLYECQVMLDQTPDAYSARLVVTADDGRTSM